MGKGYHFWGAPGNSLDYFQGSLNYPFGEDQTLQMYGNFGEFFPYNSALFGLVI